MFGPFPKIRKSRRLQAKREKRQRPPICTAPRIQRVTINHVTRDDLRCTEMLSSLTVEDLIDPELEAWLVDADGAATPNDMPKDIFQRCGCRQRDDGNTYYHISILPNMKRAVGGAGVGNIRSGRLKPRRLFG